MPHPHFQSVNTLNLFLGLIDETFSNWTVYEYKVNWEDKRGSHSVGWLKALPTLLRRATQFLLSAMCRTVTTRVWNTLVTPAVTRSVERQTSPSWAAINYLLSLFVNHPTATVLRLWNHFELWTNIFKKL